MRSRMRRCPVGTGPDGLRTEVRGPGVGSLFVEGGVMNEGLVGAVVICGSGR